MSEPSALVFPPPDQYDPHTCALIVCPVAFVPFVWGALQPLQERSRWETDEDWQKGYEAVAAIGECIMSTCLDDLIESNNRIYRLMNNVFTGQVYEVVDDSTDPPTISPTIPLVPDTTTAAILPGLLARMQRIEHLIDSTMNETAYSDYAITPGVRDLLQQILAKNTEGDEDQIAQLLKLLELLELLA